MRGGGGFAAVRARRRPALVGSRTCHERRRRREHGVGRHVGRELHRDRLEQHRRLGGWLEARGRVQGGRGRGQGHDVGGGVELDETRFDRHLVGGEALVGDRQGCGHGCGRGNGLGTGDSTTGGSSSWETRSAARRARRPARHAAVVATTATTAARAATTIKEFSTFTCRSSGVRP